MKFDQIVRDYSGRHSKWMKKITSPLEILGVGIFIHYSISNDGKFITVTNLPDSLDCYYGENLHLSCPYFVNPKFVRSGATMCRTIESNEYQNTLDYAEKKYAMDNPLLILEKTETEVEGYFFATIGEDKNVNFIDNLHLFKKYVQYFQREKEGKFNLHDSLYNIKNERGGIYEVKPCDFALAKDVRESEFIRSLYGLSKRESECLLLVQKGLTAKEVGAQLNLSVRTVEDYIGKIKYKTNALHKGELFNL